MAMSPEKKAAGKVVYDTLVSHLHSINLNFSNEELGEDYVIKFNMSGDDLPMRFFIYVKPEKQVVTLHSPQPVKFAEDKRDLGYKAICAINYRLSDGDFQIDPRDGEVLFNMTNCYAGCQVGGELFRYMLGMSVNIVDEFNDKLLMLAKGLMDIDVLLKDLQY